MGDSLNAVIAQGFNPGQAIGWAQGMTQLQQQRFNLQQAQLQPAYQAMRQVMATTPNPTWDNVSWALGQAKRLGANTDGMVNNMHEAIAGGGKAADWIRANAMGGMSPFEQGQLVYPSPMSLQTQQGTYYGTTPGMATPGAGTFQGAGFMGRGYSPEYLAQPVTIQTPQGPVTINRGQLINAMGGGGAGGGGPVSSGAPGGLTGDKAQDLKIIAQRESGGDPTALNYVAKADPTAYARGATASGKYQIVNSTWRQGAAWAGVDTTKWPTARDAPESVQDQVAGALYDHLGTTPWQKGAQDWVRGPGGGYTLQAVAPGTGGGSISPAMQPGGVFLGATAAQPAAAPTVPVSPERPPFQYIPPAPGMGGGGPGGGAPIPGVTFGPGGYQIREPPAYLEGGYKAGSAAYWGQQQTDAGLSGRMQPAISALTILRSNPDLQTGKGQQDINQFRSLLQGFGYGTPPEVKSLADYEELGKWLVRNMQGQVGANPTDLARMETEAGNANPNMRPRAIEELMATQIGLERMKSAAFRYFQAKYPASPINPDGSFNPQAADNRSQFFTMETEAFMRSQDPMAYARDYLPLAAQKDYYNHLNAADQRRYQDSTAQANRLFQVNPLLAPPDFASGPSPPPTPGQ